MILYDLVDPAVLVEYARQVPTPNFTLDRFLPNRNIRDIEYRFSKAALADQDAAPFRAFDAEAAIGKRQGIARVSGELPPISKKMRLGEEARLRLEMLRSGDNSAIIDQIFDDAAAMVRAVQARIELARGEALSTGVVAIDENGVQATVDYGIPATHLVTPLVTWDTVATATPLADLLAWRQTYVDDTGAQPGGFLTSTAVIGNLMRNAELRDLAGVGATVPSILTLANINAIFNAHGLPGFEAYDTTVRVDGVATRTISEDKLIILPSAGEPLGATFYGVTAEELELRQAGVQVQGDGGLVTVVDRTSDPVATWTKAAGIALPVVANADLLMVATVL